MSTEGDIILTNIVATQVVAITKRNGRYFLTASSRAAAITEFKSNKGNITIRISGDSAFRLEAASPARRIALNDFWNNNLKTHDGRKYVGDAGDGRSSVSIINRSGQITFMRR